jgi:methionyl-tRNA synthetase
MAEYKESCIWYFDIGINIVNFYIKAYKDKWAKSQNRIYKTADFNLKYFTSSYPESLNKIVQKLCREVMKNNIIVKKES